MHSLNLLISFCVATALLPSFAETYTIATGEHSATQYGRISYPKRSGKNDTAWMNITPSVYTYMGVGDISNLNGTDSVGSDAIKTWLKNNLSQSQLRFDGWFQVSSDKAGTWAIKQYFDDYFALYIDDTRILYNNTYKEEQNATIEVTEGWHRFTIIAGDTYGGYGSSKDYGDTIGRVPFTVTVNETTYAFNKENFPQGADDSTVILSEDTDWSSYDSVILKRGAVLNLNGYKLTVKKLICEGIAFVAGGEGSELRFVVADDTYTNLGEATYIDGATNIMFSANAKIVLAKTGDGTTASNRINLGDKVKAEFVQPGGTVSLTNGITGIGADSNGACGHGIWRMDGGIIKTSSSSEFRVGNYGVGEFIQTAGDVTIGDWISIGREPNSLGTYTITGGTLTATKDGRSVWLGGADGAKGVWNIGGNSVVHVHAICLGGQNSVTSTGELHISGDARVTVDTIFRAAHRNSTSYSTTFSVSQSGGELNVNGDINLPSFGGKGSFVQTGGKMTSKSTVYIGCGNGKTTSKPSVGTLDIGGEFTAGGAGVSLGQHKGGTGTLYLREGGVLTTPTIYRNDTETDTYGYAILEGGTVKAKENTDGYILRNLTKVAFGGGEVVFDTDGQNKTFSNIGSYDVNWAGTFVKDGEGSLTAEAFLSSGKIEVRKGTLAFTEGCDNSRTAKLAHRWSFDGDLKDSITGESGTMYGKGATFANGQMSLPGGKKGTCYVDLGANKLPGDNVTIEMWMTPQEAISWEMGFTIGDYKLSFNTRRASADKYVCNFDACGGTQKANKPLETGKKYYVAMSLEADGKDGVIVHQYVKEVGVANFFWTNRFTKANWSVSADVDDSNFWIGHSHSSTNPDTKGDFDEVRVWSCALTPEQIAWNSSAKPDALFGALEIASGATLDLGGGTVVEPILLPSAGTLKNGTLKISEKVVASASAEMIVASGATLDLTAAQIAIEGEVPQDGFTVATASEGGIVSAAPRKIGNGLWFFTTSSKAYVGRKGFTLIIR